MTHNMGTTDRAVRLVLGLALILLPLLTPVAAATAWLWWGMIVLGAVYVATAATGVCPGYLPFGIRTCRAG